jgi:GNAT superfamily N-acetyltransferase
VDLRFRSVTINDTAALTQFYSRSQRYFDIIAAPIPMFEDVCLELETAFTNPRRQLEFALLEDQIVAYTDVTFDYPNPKDATVNLLLVSEQHQHLGIGSTVMRQLEQRCRGRATRLLAGVYGDNPGAVRFWERLGYHFEIDARPVLSWYAKHLEPIMANNKNLETAELVGAARG